jgi:hypothetical protein
LAALGAFGYGKVKIAVVIVVSPGGAMFIALRENARSQKDLCKRPITIVLIKVRGRIEVIINEQIDISVVIEIAQIGSPNGNPGPVLSPVAAVASVKMGSLEGVLSGTIKWLRVTSNLHGRSDAPARAENATNTVTAKSKSFTAEEAVEFYPF